MALMLMRRRKSSVLKLEYYFTRSFTFLGDLIQLNYRFFVRKFIAYVFIDCFIGIWTRFAFPSQTAFQYVRQLQMHLSRFGRVRRFIACRSLKLGVEINK